MTLREERSGEREQRTPEKEVQAMAMEEGEEKVQVERKSEPGRSVRACLRSKRTAKSEGDS